MKRTLLIILVTSCAMHLRAQQFKINPVDTVVTNKLFIPGLKFNDQLKPALQPYNFHYTYPGLQQNLLEENIEYRMPVVVLSGNSKMPIAGLYDNSRMPVVRIGSAYRQPIPQAVLPGMPTFAAPGS